MKKRIVSLLIVFCMVCTLLPIGAIAEDAWLWPIDGVYALARGYYSGHYGIDIAASLGNTVRAAKSGTVVESANNCPHTNYGNVRCNGNPCNGGCGNYVKIKHDDGTYSRYLHLQQGTAIAVGTYVHQGDRIGLSGSSGDSSGPHLHFDAFNTNNQRINSNPTDSRHTYSGNHEGVGISYVYVSGGTTPVDDSLSLSGYNYPSSLNVGQKFSIYGTVSSGSSNISSLTVGVYSTSGAWETGKTVNPNSRSYSISNVDAYVRFDYLDAGTHYYRITATNASGTKQLLNRQFTVVGAPALTVNKTTNHKYLVTIPADYLLKNYTSPTDTNALSDNYVLWRDEPYTLTCKAKYEMSDNSVRYFWTSGDEPPKDLYFIFDPSCMSVTPKHSYTSSVTDPTCTAQGYTTYTCSCGDTYKGNYTAALGHSYSFGKCTRCGKIDPNSINGECGNNLKWELKDGVLSIGGTGEMYNYSQRNPAPWAEDYKEDIVSIKLSNGVTSIGECAFAGCTNLTTANIDNSVKSFIGFLNRPNTVTSIGYNAFYGCTGLTTVTIPDSVVSIGDYVFSGCSSLTSIDVSEDNERFASIDGVMFNKSLTELICCPCGRSGGYTVPDGVTSINNYAFSGCSALESVTIPHSVTRIEGAAFSGCRSLKSVTIPDSVTRIYGGAFFGCSALENITIPDSITEIEGSAFSDCSGLKNVILPDSITKIGEYAFSKCAGLTSMTMPNGLTRIDSNAFYACTGLTSVTIPNSVNHIGAEVFCACSNLKNVILPDSINCIPDGLFAHCDSLESIIIPESVTVICDYAFGDCKHLKSITIPNGATEIGEAAFTNCDALSSIYIPQSVDHIWTGAFSGSTDIKNVYYSGSASQWKSIRIGDFNNGLIKANIHYNYSPHTHNYTAVVTKPTCTEKGYTTYTCICGDSYKDNYTTALGHNYSYKVSAEPTTSVTGTLKGTCSRCSATTTTTLPKLNTTDYIYKVTKQANCTATGTASYTWKTTTYGTFTFTVTLAKLDHSYDAVVTKPTCTAQGYTTYTCSCGDSYKGNYVDALGHNFVNGTCTRCGETQAQDNPFRDVKNSDYFFEPVLWAYYHDPQIIAGTGAGVFSPNSSCTRAQAVTFLWRAKGNPAPHMKTSPFADVKNKNDYFYDAVLWAYENGIVYGTDETHFSPNAKVDRAQFITFLWRYMDEPTAKSKVNPFKDVKSSDYYYDAVLWGNENEIVYGVSDDSFAPTGICTRAQVAAFIYRAFA